MHCFAPTKGVVCALQLLELRESVCREVHFGGTTTGWVHVPCGVPCGVPLIHSESTKYDCGRVLATSKLRFVFILE